MAPQRAMRALGVLAFGSLAVQAATVTVTYDIVDHSTGSYLTVAGGVKYIPPGFATLYLKASRTGAWAGNPTLDPTQITMTGANVGPVLASSGAGLSFGAASCSAPGGNSVCYFLITPTAGSVVLDYYTTIEFGGSTLIDSSNGDTSIDAAGAVLNVVFGFLPSFDVSAGDGSGAASVLSAGQVSTTTLYLKVTLAQAGLADTAGWITSLPTLDTSKIAIYNSGVVLQTQAAVGIIFTNGAAAAKPAAGESYFTITLTSALPDVYTINFLDGAITDGAGVSSCAVANALPSFTVGFVPTLLLTATNTAGSGTGAAGVYGANAVVYLKATKPGGWTGTPTLNSNMVQITRGDSSSVVPVQVGIVITAGAATMATEAYWTITIQASPTSDTYTISLLTNAIIDSNTAASMPAVLSAALKVGFSVSASVVRVTSTSTTPYTFSSPLTGVAIDPHDPTIYLKIVPTNGLSTFPACPTVNTPVSNFVFKNGASAVQTAAFPDGAATYAGLCGVAVYIPVTFTTAAAPGAWSLDLAANALSTNSGYSHSVATTGGAVISLASTSLVMGHSILMSVRDVNEATGLNYISPTGVSGSYKLRLTFDDSAPPTITSTASFTTIDATKISVYYNSLPTSAITVTAVGATTGATWIEFPITIAATAAAGTYTFGVSSPGALIISGYSTGAITTGVSNNARMLTQTVGIGFTVDLVTPAGASYGTSSVDLSGGVDVTAYLRLTRITGSMAGITFVSQSGNLPLVFPITKDVATTDSTHNFYFSFDTTAGTPYALTDTTVDFPITIPATTSGHRATAGTYTIAFTEGVFAVGGFQSAAVAAAVPVRVAYAVSTAGLISDGATNSLAGTWLGPVTSGAYLRIVISTATTTVAGASAAIRTDGTPTSDDVSVDTSKIKFYDANANRVYTFAFTGDVDFDAVNYPTYVEVGLDTTGVAPGIYTVKLDAGAFTDMYGVSSQPQSASIATINIGFGLYVQYWKSDAATNPAATTPLASTEWVDKNAMVLIKLSPDAIARANGILLSNDGTTSNVVWNTLEGATTLAPGWESSGATSSLVKLGATTAGLGYLTSADTLGRPSYYYKTVNAVGGSPLTPGVYSGSVVITQGKYRDATGTLRNYATVLPDLRVGFQITPTLVVPGNARSYAGWFNPYITTSFKTGAPPVPLNTHLALSVLLTKDSGTYISGATGQSASTAIFSSFPLSSTIVATAGGTTSVLKYTMTNIQADKVAPGVYDITIPSGVLVDSGAVIGNSEVRFRVIVGMPAALYDAAGVVPATLRSSNQSEYVYVTSGKSIVWRQTMGDTSTLASSAQFASIYNKVYRNGDSTIDITALVGGTTSTYIGTSGAGGNPYPATAYSNTANVPYYADFALDITGLSDGTDYYVFKRYMTGASTPNQLLPDVAAVNEWVWPDVAVIVDRTPPTASDVRYAGTPPYLAAAATVPIPSTMFSDTVSALPSQITIISATASDMHGFVLTPGPVGTASLTATSVMGPEGDVIFTVTASDEAGNTVTARLTVTVYALRTPLISIADARGVYTSGTLTTGTAQAVGSFVVLTVIATFPEAVSAIVAGDLHITVPSYPSAYGHAAPTLGAPVSSANGRVWTWSVNLPTGWMSDGQRWEFIVASSTGRTVAKSLLTGPSAPAYAAIDSHAPAAYAVVSSYTAVVGIPFFAIIPVTMHNDFEGGATLPTNPYATVATNIDIVSGAYDVSVGLSLTNGKAGAAYVAGTAATVPAPGMVTFTITARDAAGNAVSTGTFKVRVVTQLAAGYGPTLIGGFAAPPTLTFDATTATYTDGNAAPPSLVLSSGANFVSTNAQTSNPVGVDSVLVYLVTPDMGSNGEVVTGAGGTWISAANPTVSTTMGAVGFNLITSEVWSRAAGAASGIIYASDVIAYLRALTYTDANPAPTSGTRVVHVAIIRDGYVVGYVNKKISVVSVDAAPTVAIGSVSAVSYTEALSLPVIIAPTLAVADIDDTQMTKATFTIATTGTGGYGACDATRDVLSLPAGYMAPGTPLVEASWDTSSCTLTLAPAGSVSAVATQDMQAAMRAVVYSNLNLLDPANGVTTGVNLLRHISVYVTDDASGGQVSTTKTSSAAVSTLTLVPVDTAATISLPLAYAVGGMFYETDTNANWKAYVDPASGNTYNIRKFSVVVDPTVHSSTTYYVSIDLTEQSPRHFGALGAIYDVDGLTPVATGNEVTFAAVNSGSYTSLSNGVSVGLNLGGVDASSNPLYVNTISGAKSRLPITIANPAAAGVGGEVQVTMTYGNSGPSVVFFIDIRPLGCTVRANLGSALDMNTLYPSASVCASTLAGDALVNLAVAASVGGTAKPADYAVLSAAVINKAAALLAAGSSTADAIVAASTARGAARGQYVVVVAPNSFSTTSGSIALSALPLDAATVLAIPPVGATESTDAAVSLHLQPACQTFTTPVQVCVFVGDTAAGTTRNLRFTSQLDCSDASKGYGAYEPATGQTFNPVSGQLCGYVSHFSLGVVVVTTIGVTPVIPKIANMGGSCPNGCSGQGYCRAEGKCVCFKGYTGYDCSARSCPVAQSWDATVMSSGSDASDDGLVVHSQVQCGNRGVCNPASGACACFAGYTGAACDRLSCPSSCSGRGRCLTLGELPDVVTSGYSSWELSRIAVCSCDGGFTGPDCSLRVCPFGDDPETTCSASAKQVQTLTLDFGTIPASLPSGTLPLSLLDIDELVLTFTTTDGTPLQTNTITNLYDPFNGGITSVTNALTSLPGFAVNAVTVTATGSSTSPLVSYAITFDGGLITPTTSRAQVSANTVSGNQALLQCPSNLDGSMGCVVPGCRPLFQQARLFDTSGDPGIVLNDTAILMQPPSLYDAILYPTAHTASTAAQWGVDVYVYIAQDGVTGQWTYAVTSNVYGSGGGATIATTPIPPGNLRLGVPLVYGLVVDFSSSPTASGASRGARFSWRLPTCTVTQTQSADSDYESTECGGRGNCNRATGNCACFNGYSGYACSQQTVIV